MSYEIKDEQDALNIIARLEKTIREESDKIIQPKFHFYPSNYTANQYKAKLSLGVSNEFLLLIGSGESFKSFEAESILGVVQNFCNSIIESSIGKIILLPQRSNGKVINCSFYFDDGFWRISKLIYIDKEEDQKAP